MDGYMIQLGPAEYEGWSEPPEGGAPRPFTLAEAWAEVEGVGQATILHTSGRVVLADAGSMTTRLVTVPQRARRARRAARR